MRCHSDHFRPFPMISEVFMEFPMFARLYLTYCYINGLSMHSPYYSILIWCVPDILRLCFDFIYLWRYQYSDVSIIYSFGWLYYYYRFGLWSLWTISSIRSFWRHFDLFEVIFTYIYIALSFYNNNIVLRSPQLCETLYHFDSTSTSFPFVPRPNISHIDLAPSIFRCFSSHFTNFAPISLNLSLYTSDFEYRHNQSFTFFIQSFSGQILTIYNPYITTLAI